MHFLWRWLVSGKSQGKSDPHLIKSRQKDDERFPQVRIDERGGNNIEKGWNHTINSLIPAFSPVARQTPTSYAHKLLAPLYTPHRSLLWCLSRVVPHGQKMTNIPPIFIFHLHKGRQTQRRRRKRDGVMKRRRRRRRSGPFHFHSQPWQKRQQQPLYSHQKRYEKQMQRGRGAQQNREDCKGSCFHATIYLDILD